MRRLLPLVLGLSAPVFAADLTGKWTFATNILGTRETVECSLRQDAAKLSGSCRGDQFPESQVSGSFRDDKFQIAFVYLFAGQAYTCTYTAKVSGDTKLSGAIVVSGVDGVTGEFRGTRQPK